MSGGEAQGPEPPSRAQRDASPLPDGLGGGSGSVAVLLLLAFAVGSLL
jgi:hypothetical protein